MPICFNAYMFRCLNEKDLLINNRVKIMKILSKKKLIIIILVLIIPQIVFAQTNELETYLGSIYTWSIGIGGALAIFMIATAGIEYASSMGDVEKINKAKERILGSILGLLLLVLTFVIVQSLQSGTPKTTQYNSSGTENLPSGQEIIPDTSEPTPPSA